MYHYSFILEDADGVIFNQQLAHIKKWDDKKINYFFLKAMEVISQNEEANELDISENIDEILDYMVDTFSFSKIETVSTLNIYYDFSLDKVKSLLSKELIKND